MFAKAYMGRIRRAKPFERFCLELAFFCKRREFVSGLYKLRKTHPPEGYGL
jgi:hypothetical protein